MVTYTPSTPVYIVDSTSSKEEVQRVVDKVMEDTEPAQESDYCGNKYLNTEKREELFSKMRSLINRGVSSKALLARTLGVNRKTIYKWMRRYELEQRRRDDDRDFRVDRMLIYDRIEEIMVVCWQLISAPDISNQHKISLVHSVVRLIDLQARITGVYNITLLPEAHHQNNIASEESQEERERLCVELESVLVQSV